MLPVPMSRIECEEVPQYVLQRTPPVTFLNGARLPGGHQVCVEITWSIGVSERNWVKTEDGLSGWVDADDLGTWQEYLASRDGTVFMSTPTAISEPASRIECEEAPQYVLAGPLPATFSYSSRELAPGLQVCVRAVMQDGGSHGVLQVQIETGETGMISSRHVGTWQAYLASLDPSIPTPTATPRPTRTPGRTATPRPTRTPTPTVVQCRDAWGGSAVPYRVRTGPGTNHAHTGLFVQAGQLVCEIGRDQGWVRIRLADGTEGWVHGEGVTNSRPTPMPIPTATPAVPSTPTAIPAPAAASLPATTTASGIVIHTRDYTIEIPAGWAKLEWSSDTDAIWDSGQEVLRVRTYSQPAGTTLDRFAEKVRDTIQEDWREEGASLLEITAFGKRQVGGQDRYYLNYRVQANPCLFNIEEAIGLGQAQVGPARGVRALHRTCEHAATRLERVRRGVLDSLRVVVGPPGR